MSSYKHGVNVNEEQTSLVAPVTSTAGLQVVIGTAPVNLLANPAAAVNKPILVNNKKEAVTAVGYSDDFADYTLCEAISAAFDVVGCGPLILINVLDPATHKTAITETTLTVNNHMAVLEVKGALKAGLTVKQNTTALVEGTDYTLAFDDNGYLNIVLLSGGAAYSATSLKVAGNKIDPSAVTAADIVGSVNVSTGEEKGLEVVRQIFPKLSLVPGILTAPRWSMDATVAAALQAKTKEINGAFTCVCIVDISSKTGGALLYTDVNTQKAAQAVSDPNAYAVWPCAKVGDKVYSGSSIAAPLTAYTDAVNADVPNVSPSNKPVAISGICLADGTEVILDQDQANTINSFGVGTFLNYQGWRLWGNNTAAYPGNTDPKDRWFCIKRFLKWAANTFILTYFQVVDNPANKPLIGHVVDSENVRGNGFVARNVCARYEIVYLAEENPTTELLNGHLTFHQYISPYTPAEHIQDKIEFDPYALSAALNA